MCRDTTRVDKLLTSPILTHAVGDNGTITHPSADIQATAIPWQRWLDTDKHGHVYSEGFICVYGSSNRKGCMDLSSCLTPSL